MKYVVGFCLFWWDFIVGDSIVLALGGIIALVGAFALAHGGFGTAAEVMLPAAVVVTLVAALGRP
jgi:hypothetical protein